MDKRKTKMSFGHRVRKHRALLQASVRDVSPAIGISPATLSRVENGNVPDIFTLGKLCRWMRFPVEQAIIDLS